MHRVKFLSVAALGIAGVVGLMMMPGHASSHREAPFTSGDPYIDHTDVYAFVSPDKPDSVTLIASWIPLEEPAGGPIFYRFEAGAQYDINVDNNGDAVPDIIYRWVFQDEVRNPNTFLYNTGPINSLDDPNLNLKQTYTLQIISNGNVTATIGPIPTLYINVGEPSTPSYFGKGTGVNAFNDPAGGTGLTFAGQTDDAFFLDLRVFNLLYGTDLKQIGTDTLKGFNVHSVAIQVPKAAIRRGGTGPTVGVWSTTQRQATRVQNADGTRSSSGNFVQVSRLGMPLVNEVVIPVGMKDRFNASKPVDDGQFLPFVQNPELARLLNLIYKVGAKETDRADLVSVFLTGVAGLNQLPNGRPSEMLRLNTDIGPSARPSRLGVLDGDLAGFPNGRRLTDDVVDIAEQVVAGALIGNKVPLSDAVDQNDVPFLRTFPYLGIAHSGAKAKPHQ